MSVSSKRQFCERSEEYDVKTIMLYIARLQNEFRQ